MVIVAVFLIIVIIFTFFGIRYLVRSTRNFIGVLHILNDDEDEAYIYFESNMKIEDLSELKYGMVHIKRHKNSIKENKPTSHV